MSCHGNHAISNSSYVLGQYFFHLGGLTKHSDAQKKLFWRRKVGLIRPCCNKEFAFCYFDRYKMYQIIVYFRKNMDIMTYLF